MLIVVDEKSIVTGYFDYVFYALACLFNFGGIPYKICFQE